MMILHSPIAIGSVPSIPWKNGGGTTRQLAVKPGDAATSDFLWRVSIAQIDSPGKFSVFPEIDRTILLWRGDGVTLRSAAWPNHRLDDPRAPLCFRGEEEVVCDLLGGATQDLNLMVRRGRVAASFEVVTGERYEVPACDDFLLLCASGSAMLAVRNNDPPIEVGADQFLRILTVGKDEALVVARSNALLIAIAIRVLTNP